MLLDIINVKLYSRDVFLSTSDTGIVRTIVYGMEHSLNGISSREGIALPCRSTHSPRYAQDIPTLTCGSSVTIEIRSWRSCRSLNGQRTRPRNDVRDCYPSGPRQVGNLDGKRSSRCKYIRHRMARNQNQMTLPKTYPASFAICPSASTCGQFKSKVRTNQDA
ncbi:hypothetical protein OG21DRAFT_719575 [Imleria badia]|nr:hypothetical protein OG21DRAFT_719575 [Imleria badia]